MKIVAENVRLLGVWTMNAMAKLKAAVVLAGATSVASMSASAWWNDDDDYDRWYGGRWYGYPDYGWGGCPGYGWGGYPYYGWGACRGYGWGGHPGYGYDQPKTIIVNPQVNDGSSKPAPKLPK
jgi:hypothetical protein